MENKKLLTIGITAYNEEKYIKRCLDSIITAFYNLEEIEIIISNNNSTDRTLEIVEEYQNKYDEIKVITTTKKGPSVARNAVIKNAKGKYLTFVDGDDYVDQKMGNIIGILKEYDNIDVINFSYNIYKKGEVFIPEICSEKQIGKIFNRRDFLSALKLNAAFSSSSSKIVKLETINKFGLEYDEKYFQMEDMQFTIKIWGVAESFLFVNNVFYHYETNHEGGLTQKFSLNRMLMGFNAAKDSIEWIEKNVSDKNEKKKLRQFASLLSFSLVRKYKDLDNQDKEELIKFLNKNLIVFKYPHCLLTKIFKLVFKCFGLKFALKFI